MGKAEAAKNMAEESSEKDIDHIKALMGIAQVGKLGQVESLVLQLALLSKEMTTSRDEAANAAEDICGTSRRLSKETITQMGNANTTLREAIMRADSFTTRLENLSRRPGWEPFALALVSAFVMSAFVAGILYVTLPDYGQITKNQVAIYHAVETVKGVKTKGQAGK